MVGYRLWRLTRDQEGNFRLMSHVFNTLWEEEMEAVCITRLGPVADHLEDDLLRSKSKNFVIPGLPPFVVTCMCGIYGFKRVQSVLEEPTKKRVIGVIDLFGTVLETEMGYRATNAMVNSIIEHDWVCTGLVPVPYHGFWPSVELCGAEAYYAVPWYLRDRIVYPGLKNVEVLNEYPREFLFLCQNCVDMYDLRQVATSKRVVYGSLSKYYGVPVIPPREV